MLTTFTAGLLLSTTSSVAFAAYNAALAPDGKIPDRFSGTIARFTGTRNCSGCIPTQWGNPIYGTRTSSLTTRTSSLKPTPTPLNTANCPADNGRIYTDPQGDNYRILCNTDFSVGNNLDITSQDSLAACLKRCSVYNSQITGEQQRCAGANYRLDQRNCYLKPDTENRFSDDQVLSGVLLLLESRDTSSTTTKKTKAGDDDDDAGSPADLRLPPSLSISVPGLTHRHFTPTTLATLTVSTDE